MSDFVQGILIGAVTGIILGIFIGFKLAIFGVKNMIDDGKISWNRKLN
jgi:hypothetical protein